MAAHGPSAAWSFHTDTSYPPTPPVLRAEARAPADDAVVALPPPQCPQDVSLTAAIAGRVSCRRFSGASLTLEEVSAVLHAAYGVHGNPSGSPADEEVALRPVPSAGARYPLEIHLIVSSVARLGSCTYRYLPSQHGLADTGGIVSPEEVGDIFLDQPYLTTASAFAVVAARLGPSLARYGDRGYRYILFEAGHVAQNINLACSALRLGSLNLGGFWDQALSRVLGLAEHVPLYGVALGRLSTADMQELRQPIGGWP